MYLLKIDYNLCDGSCIQFCHAIIDEFLFLMEEDPGRFLIHDPDKALNSFESKILKVKCICKKKGKKAISFDRIIAGD